MAASARWRTFATREDLAAQLAADVADRLRAAIKAKGGATLAVSGGTTPALFFETLSHKDLDWTKVIATLVDERFVPPSSERSNERLVREKLLRNEARLARFVGLYSDATDVDEAARRAEAGVALLGSPLDVVVLGMGTDGHTASFFPDAPNLDALTNPSQARRVLSVDTASSGEPRLTLTMPLIANARFLALHIEGDAKREALDRALAEKTKPLPIRMVVNRAASGLQIYSAPTG
ncbi:MAG: 6-phosphogluconolactonase [Pseudomonadota bacterium]